MIANYAIYNLTHHRFRNTPNLCVNGIHLDKFIRDFYRGGRVEIFHMGRVPRDTLYYLDFTSLYPWAGTKSLPYGEPVWVDHLHEISLFFELLSP